MAATEEETELPEIMEKGPLGGVSYSELMQLFGRAVTLSCRSSFHLSEVRQIIMPYYAVRTGRNPGIYNDWDSCREQVNQYPKARYKKFNTKEEAQAFVNGSDNPSNSSSRSRSTYQTYNSNSYSSGSYVNSRSYSYSSYGNSGDNDQDSSSSDEEVVSFSNKRTYNFGGAGLSGYGYNKQTKRYKSTDASFSDNGPVSVYTDGACFDNGKNGARAGIGVYWGPNHERNVSERLEGRQTNNRAEIHAARHAIQQAKSHGIKDIKIYTDSQFLINGMTKWIHGWKKNGWKLTTGQPVVNREDFEALEKASKGINVQWEHVRGHQGIAGNEAADKLANEGALKHK